MLRVVPLTQYCVLSGENENAVKRRIERGHWVLGVHYHKNKNVRERAIDLEGVENWWREGSSEFL